MPTPAQTSVRMTDTPCTCAPFVRTVLHMAAPAHPDAVRRGSPEEKRVVEEMEEHYMRPEEDFWHKTAVERMAVCRRNRTTVEPSLRSWIPPIPNTRILAGLSVHDMCAMGHVFWSYPRLHEPARDYTFITDDEVKNAINFYFQPTPAGMKINPGYFECMRAYLALPGRSRSYYQRPPVYDRYDLERLRIPRDRWEELRYHVLYVPLDASPPFRLCWVPEPVDTPTLYPPHHMQYPARMHHDFTFEQRRAAAAAAVAVSEATAGSSDGDDSDGGDAASESANATATADAGGPSKRRRE